MLRSEKDDSGRRREDSRQSRKIRRGPRHRRPAGQQHHLEQLLADEPPEVQAEIIRINTDARHIALQVALLIPIAAGLVGLFNSFRMMRLPDPVSSGSAEGMVIG